MARNLGIGSNKDQTTISQVHLFPNLILGEKRKKWLLTIFLLRGYC